MVAPRHYSGFTGSERTQLGSDILAKSFGGCFAGKRVLVTGHTGFKGSWLCEWLTMLDAQVSGVSLPPETEPSLFEQLQLKVRMDHRLGDIRDTDFLNKVVQEVQPEFVFHLAAQALVRESYSQPVDTFATNVMGTVNLMEAVRLAGCSCMMVLVTTDKCYENREWLHGYREEDALGGHDPYSASKGAAEIAIASYRRSFFGGSDCPVRVASARAGNVIGGGDWAKDRILPDCVRYLMRGRHIPVRNAVSTRPWQHVLEPLSGYLNLAWRMADAGDAKQCEQLCSAFNFGPATTSNQSVGTLVKEVLKHWPGGWESQVAQDAPHEAGLLNLCIDKAYHLLEWKPVWDFETTVERTVNWYRRVCVDTKAAKEQTREQILSYNQNAKALALAWAQES